MSKENTELTYKAHGITFERCELYGDITQSLILLIFDTYMGDDVTSPMQQIQHFNWCWNRNMKNFKVEGVLYNSDNLYNYFLEFMRGVFYSMTKKDESKTLFDNVLKVWLYIFDYNIDKSAADLNRMVEVFQLFDEAFERK